MMKLSAVFDWEFVAALEIAEPTVALPVLWNLLADVWWIRQIIICGNKMLYVAVS